MLLGVEGMLLCFRVLTGDAAIGVGLIEEWTDVERFVRLGNPIEPDASAHAAMELGYGVYRDLEAALRPLSHRLARA